MLRYKPETKEKGKYNEVKCTASVQPQEHAHFKFSSILTLWTLENLIFGSSSDEFEYLLSFQFLENKRKQNIKQVQKA